MRNLKKFLALVLAMLMIVSASAVVSASDFTDVADDSIYAEAIADLVEKGITNGVAAGQFGPDQPVQRFQMALFMARALEPDVDDWMTGMQVFDDVNEWYGAIAYAYVNNIVTGMGNNLFAPHDGIRYQDALIMALRALGYKVDVSGDPYWLAAYNQAQALGLTKGVEVYVGEQVLTRAETAQIIYNMLYTTPADGGATIAAKNFGEATAANTTTFIITATPKQAYAESYKAAEEGYVGIQALVNGLPTGDVIYLPAAALGLKDDNVETYFSYAVNLVNYDEATSKFDKAFLGEAPVVINNLAVSKSGTKITIDGVAYYPADQFTGAALKNEIVVFNGGEFASAAKMLLTNKDGDIVNYDGTVVATFAYETATGAKYYVDKDVSSGTKVISEAAALEKYGVEIDDGTYTKYATLTADSLDAIGNYQLSLFDDDLDGKYERAVATPIYMSAYKAQDSNKETFGPMKGTEGVTYSDDTVKVKGTVFTYTYNSQTKVVNVIDTLDIQYGTLTKVDTTKLVSDKIVKLTIDGKVYTIANADLAKKTGATIYDYDAQGFDKIASDAQLGYLGSYTELKVGSPIKFYALNDYVINAKTYDIEESFERVVISEIVSYDSANIYADLYMSGVLVKNVAISNVEGQKVSSMNIFQLSRLLSDNAWKTGNVFRAVKLADGSYQISEEFDADTNRVDFKLVTHGYTSKIEFDDGIADIRIGSDSIIQGEYVIRSNDNTVFYFLKKNDEGEITSIASYVGAPDNSSIDFSSATGNNIELYADKIGYGSNEDYKNNKYNGVASFVLVYYTNASDIKGFGVANIEYTTVYVVDNADKVKAYEAASAEDLGLVGSEYVGKYYVRYSADGLAVDMGSGAKVNTIYVEVGDKIEANKFYVLSSDNVLLDDATVKTASLKAGQFIQNRYYTIGRIVAPADKVSTVYLTGTTAIDVKTTVKDVLKDANKEYTVKYIEDYADGSFVGVVSTTSDGASTGNVNAKWTGGSGSTYSAISSDIKTSDYEVSGKVFVASNDGTAVSFGGYYSSVEYDDAWTGLTSDAYKVASVKVTDEKGKEISGAAYNVSVTIDSNNIASFTVTSVKDASKPFSNAVKFVSGNYIITITFEKGVNNTAPSFEIPVTID